MPTPRDLGLRSDSFTAIGPDTGSTNRVIVNVEGGQKSGKDHWALTAPSPIVVFNWDNGLEGVAEKFIRGQGVPKREITVAGCPPKKGDRAGVWPSYHLARPVPAVGQSRRDAEYLKRVKDAAVPVWERFISDLSEFYRSEARTGIIDTGGAAFALAKMAFHGMDKGRPAPKDDPYGQKSGEMKAIFQGLITDGYNFDKNCLWLHRIKEVWVNNQPSGQYSAAGYADIAYECMLTVRTKRKVVKNQGVFSAQILDCRHDPTLNGEVFEGKQCDFPTVISIVTGTDRSEWE